MVRKYNKSHRHHTGTGWYPKSNAVIPVLAGVQVTAVILALTGTLATAVMPAQAGIHKLLNLIDGPVTGFRPAPE